jgi:hypothetical protein
MTAPLQPLSSAAQPTLDRRSILLGMGAAAALCRGGTCGLQECDNLTTNFAVLEGIHAVQG